MTPYFHTPERIAKLQAVAASWIGTPFMPHAAVKGAGACCQRMAGAIYKECGFLPPDVEIPTGPMDWSNANTRSLIVEYLDGRPEFVAIEGTGLPAAAAPGDLLGFKIGGCVQHCGIQTAAGTFIHCFRKEGAVWASLRDATYFSRLEKIWRPIE